MKTRKIESKHLDELIKISQNIVRKIRATVYRHDFLSTNPRDMEREIHSKADDIVVKQFRKSKAPIWLVSDSWGPSGTIIRIMKLCERPIFIIAFDSIDGSMNLVRKIPLASTFISILRNEKISSVEYSIVCNLFTGDTFEARKGKGAMLNGKRIYTSNRRSFNNAFIGIDFSTPNLLDLIGKLERFLKNFSEFRHSDIRRLGTNSLEACLVAMGALDIFIDIRNIVKPIDIVAGKQMVEEAGGVVVDLNGKAIDGDIFSEKTYSVLFFANKIIQKKFFNLL